MINRLPMNVTSHKGMLWRNPTGLDGIYHLLGDGHTGGSHAAHIVHHRLDDAAADGEDGGHDLHGGAHRHLCRHKADQVAQGKFRALEVPETGRGLEYAHRKEQDQQAVAHRFQPVVDADDDRPDIAAPELLRRGGNEAPYLREFVVPGVERRLQITDDPVVTQKDTSSKKAERGCPLLDCSTPFLNYGILKI